MQLAAAKAPEGLKAEISSLTGILGIASTLRVPSYQRPYTWTPLEVSALIEDLAQAYRRKAPYYFVGHIVLVKVNRHDVEIADGQQRLATLTMFLAYARERLPARADSIQELIMIHEPTGARGRLVLRRADAPFFEAHVQVPGALTKLRSKTDVNNDSQAAMSDAAESIYQQLDTMSDAELAGFVRFVCQCATFDVITCDERGGAATVFATMNTRGRSLSGPDIMKQHLLERSGLPEAAAESAAGVWEGVEDQLGRNAFDQLVMHIMPLIMTGEALRSPGDLTAFCDSIKDVRSYLDTDLPRYGRALMELRACAVRAGEHSADVNRRIKTLFQLRDETAWIAPAVTYLADHPGGPEKTARFFKALDMMTHACFMQVIRSERREERFARLVRAMRQGQELFGPGKALSLSKSEHAEMIERINGSFTRDKGRRRLLIMRLNAALPGGEVICDDADVTVEHVLPGKFSGAWCDLFPDRYFRDKVSWPNILGNFVLVTNAQNKLCGTKLFDKKREIYFDAEAGPIYALTRDIEDVQEWTPAALSARHERLTSLLIRDWGL